MNLTFIDWLNTVCDGIDLSAYIDIDLVTQLTLSNDSVVSLLCDLYDEINEMEEVLAKHPGAKISLKQLGRVFVFFNFINGLTDEQSVQLELQIKTVQELRNNVVQ